MPPNTAPPPPITTSATMFLVQRLPGLVMTMSRGAGLGGGSAKALVEATTTASTAASLTRGQSRGGRRAVNWPPLSRCVLQSSPVSRRAPRYRISLQATITSLLGGDVVVCRTRDVSDVGLCLDTAAWLPVGTRVSVTMMDPRSSTAMEVIGDVVREINGDKPALGVLLIEPPVEWKSVVAHAARASGQVDKPGRRMRVLVVGDDHRQRGAMALYVSSGWDILFASDDFSVHEPLENIVLDAVIAAPHPAHPPL